MQKTDQNEQSKHFACFGIHEHSIWLQMIMKEELQLARACRRLFGGWRNKAALPGRVPPTITSTSIPLLPGLSPVILE